jgi:hypothetical protein
VAVRRGTPAPSLSPWNTFDSFPNGTKHNPCHDPFMLYMEKKILMSLGANDFYWEETIFSIGSIDDIK